VNCRLLAAVKELNLSTTHTMATLFMFWETTQKHQIYPLASNSHCNTACDL